MMWVIEWMGTNLPKDKDNLVICLHPNTDIGRVGKITELLYMVAKGSKEEKTMYAKGVEQPPAFRHREGKNHIITCGHNPYLVAERKHIELRYE